jgi:23S rRNA pseudouridine2604 synthase
VIAAGIGDNVASNRRGITLNTIRRKSPTPQPTRIQGTLGVRKPADDAPSDGEAPAGSVPASEARTPRDPGSAKPAADERGTRGAERAAEPVRSERGPRRDEGARPARRDEGAKPARSERPPRAATAAQPAGERLVRGERGAKRASDERFPRRESPQGRSEAERMPRREAGPKRKDDERPQRRESAPSRRDDARPRPESARNPRGDTRPSRPESARSPGDGPRAPVPAPRPPEARAASAAAIAEAAQARAAVEGVRLSKLMAERGLCSRREADEFIERGWVFVDGRRVSELGVRVGADVRITLAAEAARTQQQRVTLLLHKPVGYVSGQPEPGYAPAVSLIGPDNQADRDSAQRFHPSHLKNLAPAGRLDIDSTGLLVLTQDGRVARQLIGEDSKVEKEYLVRVEGSLAENGLALLNHGLWLDDRPLRPAQVEWVNDDQLRFVLREGRKRQIRRMCELVGLKVVGLKRVRIGQVKLGDLPLGQWRFLREDERFG